MSIISTPFQKIILLFFLFNGVIFMFAQTLKVQEEREKAAALYESKSYPEALAVYEKLLKADPKNTELLNLTGMVMFGLKNFEGAKEKFRLAALYCPVSDKSALSTYYSNLSAAFTYLQNDAKAYEYAIKAYEMNNTYSLTLWNAASNSQNFDKCEQAIKIMDEAKIEKHQYFDTLYGRCYLKLGEYRKSILHYEKFFANYQPDDVMPDLIMSDEKLTLLKAYLNEVKELIREDQYTIPYKTNLKKLIQELSANSTRESLMRILLSNDYQLWKRNESSRKLFKEITSAVSDLTDEEKLKIDLLVGDYKKAAENSKDYLQKNRDASAEKIMKADQYKAALNLLMADYQKNKKIDDNQLKNVTRLFQNLFEKNKIYNTEEIKQTYFDDILSYTYEIAKNHKFADADIKNLGKMIFTILKHTPNKELKEYSEKQLKQYIN